MKQPDKKIDHMKILYISILMISATLTFGQKKTEPFYTFKNQIGINFTNVLGNVLSLNPNNANSPYGLTYRRLFATSSLRTAVNGSYTTTSTNEIIGNNFNKKKLSISEFNGRLGYEKHLKLNSRMMMTYGADVLIGYKKEQSDVHSSIDLRDTKFFISKMNTFNVGLGPVLRLEFKISDRLHLSTESTLYGVFGKTVESLSINGVETREPDKQINNLRLELPQSLFFNISF